MQMWLFKATPNAALGQGDGLGFTYVTVVDEQATAGGVAPGDKIDVTGFGSISKSTLVGVKFPWEDPNAPFNGPYALVNGMLSLSVTVPASPFAGVGPFAPEGMLICSAITASGYRSPFGGYVCAYSDPSAPPPPPPAGSPATLAAAVLASYTGGPAVPNALDPTKQQVVTFTQQVQGLTLPGQVVWGPECLGIAGSQQIAKLIGGTVVTMVPPPPFAVLAVGNPPVVYGIHIVQNGVTLAAVAGEVAQEFAMFSAGSAVADIQAGIMTKFTPVL